ncbi:hypothetical protein [Bacillus sp. ISL-45]|uniref:hypothetical protein n=1 Tax=Bacillus sp. ISL-45 TaxID=2819128 RepID=UPI001BEC8FB0|nr:hypothetical protein [Bacillus sp. ISL-45]MBT2661955.1 hypothetical protein [Bacillus sp. ISL-45]
MIDIREHGGSFGGGGKYGKDSELPFFGSLGFKFDKVAEISIFSVGNNMMAMDDTGYIYLKAGSSASTGNQLINKYRVSDGTYISQLSVSTGAHEYISGDVDGFFHSKNGLKGVDRFNSSGALIGSYTTTNDVVLTPFRYDNYLVVPVSNSTFGVAIFNLDTGTKLYEWIGATAWGARGVSISKDKSRVVFFYSDGNVKVYSISGSLIQAYDDSSTAIQAYMSDDNSEVYSSWETVELTKRTIGATSPTLVSKTSVVQPINNSVPIKDGASRLVYGNTNGSYYSYFLYPKGGATPIHIFGDSGSSPNTWRATANKEYIAMQWYDKIVIVKLRGVIL